MISEHITGFELIHFSVFDTLLETHETLRGQRLITDVLLIESVRGRTLFSTDRSNERTNERTIARSIDRSIGVGSNLAIFVRARMLDRIYLAWVDHIFHDQDWLLVTLTHTTASVAPITLILDPFISSIHMSSPPVAEEDRRQCSSLSMSHPDRNRNHRKSSSDIRLFLLHVIKLKCYI